MKYFITSGGGFKIMHNSQTLLDQGEFVRILERINICTGLETRLLDLLEVPYDLFPNASQTEFAAPRAGDIYRPVGSPQKALDVMGIRAQVSLADGVQEIAEWMRG